VYLSSPAPERDAAFVGKMFDADVCPLPGGGCRVACGPAQELRVLTPQALAQRDGSLAGLPQTTPRLAGIAVSTPGKHGLTSAAQACGMFIEWVPS
jgi:hypothetical protein